MYQRYRPEQKEAVVELFYQTFKTSENEDTGRLIGDLVAEMLTEVAEGEMLVCVAMDANELIGCMIFTRLTVEPERNAFILSPAAVKTEFQGKGIGQQLIRFGLSQLRQNQVEFVLTYGDPSFYGKVGFAQISEQKIIPPYKLTFPNGWLGQSLTDETIENVEGKIGCVKALSNPTIW